MFWRFNQTQTLPPPWGPAGEYNVPVELRESSYMAVRTAMTPTFASRFAAFLSTPMTSAMIAPLRAYGAIDKHPGDAMGVMRDAHDDLRALADYALTKHVQGLPVTVDEGRALLAVHMPPVVRPQPRCGVGETMSSWDVPFCDRSTVPQATVDRQAELAAPAHAQRKLAVGREIAMIEAIRAQWLSHTARGGR